VVEKAVKSEGGGDGPRRRAAAFGRAFAAHLQKLRQVSAHDWRFRACLWVITTSVLLLRHVVAPQLHRLLLHTSTPVNIAV
jgi:hypothetical protein